ncbi:SDR family NAD(P)-dependent oxidoreductase [Streptomyces sp. NBC_00280]|uniref:SDR family NAD(P)-dependent oxidoreductase n=1 Tax=Streptomyces sp. NBC_00280 TaxID=2975699 RepID=UPI00324B401F
MNSKETRRQILERVGNGNLSVAEATALLRGATVAPTAPGGSLVVFRPGWQLTCPAPPERLPPARRTLVVLGEAVPDSLTLPAGTVAVRATPGTGWESRGTDRYDVGTADDSGWTGLWAQLRAVERLPERVVLVTGAAAENCLDTAYPLVRTLIRDRTGDAGTALALVAVGPDSGPTADALGGFCTVAAQEDRRLRLLAMALPGPAPDPVRLALAELEEPVPGLAEIRYDTEGRWVRTVAPADPTAPETPLSLPDGGVYLLAGGAGGIGLAVAALLGERTRARTVLMGRAEPDARIREALARIEAGGGRARYVQGDVTSRQDVVRAVAFARSEFGALTGVVHLAGVNEDTYIVNKEPGAQRRVLGPRIAGARFLDEATRAEPLELFVLCSTMSGYVGHAGQSDYAAAGRALGGFAVRRAEAVRRGERAGHTVSIAWPLWADGGMRLGEADRRATEAAYGMRAMSSAVGFDAMLAALGSGSPETMVVYGEAGRIRDFVAERVEGAAPVASDGATPAVADGPAESVEAELTAMIAALVRMEPGQLRPDQEFSEIGLDSVMIKRLSAALEDRLGSLPVALLFEHRTVRELAEHLQERYADRLGGLLGERTAPQTQIPVQSHSVPASSAPAVSAPPDDAIAVIGIAGRYPGAADLDRFWEGLVAGRDSTGEIPADRWDKDRYADHGDRRPGSSYGRWGGFLDDVARFDSLFFAIAPKEAVRMDPAERQFLEVAWSAIEDAGYTRARLHEHSTTDDGHAIGVYVGTTGLAYQLVGAKEWGKGNPVSAYSMEFSLANRLSYLLDAHGPSMVVDTACSASLTALHLACEALRHGECRMAVSGGAYLNLHPMKYAMLSEQRMMSPDGVCRPFGDGGNGFVPGEGVGAVLLKRLSDALADGDHVHTVIRGTAVAHGGRTNGYTVPTPRGHAAVIRSALRRAGVEAHGIGYVEAHGTGTELGDPIEFEGLTRVFRETTDERGFCALGSVKSNIGHAEAAAGIAGLTKVVLQLRHRTLVPTLHSDPPNPRLDLTDGPFRLQRALEPWDPMAVGGTPQPRRAAISSFGAGGANAHAIVEEFEDARDRDRLDRGGDQLALLSARSADRLEAMADRLATALSGGNGHPVPPLADVAYTLQVGREAMEFRLALVVRSLDELRGRLREFSAGQVGGPRMFHGRVEPGRVPAATAEPSAGQGWAELAELWTAGAEIDWAAVHQGQDDRPRVVSLPTYPFAGPVHWPAIAPSTGAVPTDGRSAHFEGRVETESGTELTLSLSPRNPVVADHLVDGKQLLAGVAQLELARAAAAVATGSEVAELTDIRWRVPLEATGARVTAVVRREDGERTAVDIVTGAGENRTVHTTVRVHGERPASSPVPLDLTAVRARCGRRLTGEEFYQRADAAGLHYGPSYRRLRTLWCGDGEALAELEPTTDGATGWWIEPGLTDAALHTLHGAQPETDNPATVPASVARMVLRAPAGQARFAYARTVEADERRGTVRCDITLYDGEGRPVVEFADFRAVRRPVAEALPYFRPVWRLRPLILRAAPSAGPVLILSTGHDHGLGNAIASRHAGQVHRVDLSATHTTARFTAVLGELPAPARIYFLGGVEDRHYTPTDLDQLEESQRTGCLALFHLAQALADARPRNTRLTVLTNDAQQTDEGVAADHPFASSLFGMARSLARELPFLDVACVDLAGTDLARSAGTGKWGPLLDAIDAEPVGVPLAEVALRDGARLVKSLEPAELPEPSRDQLPLRDGGRYLVIGGAGGLGQTVSRYLAREHDARLLLLGRRPADQLPEGVLATLQESGGEVHYRSGDVTDPDALRAAVTWMRERFGGLDGVIHTAFVLADRTIARMDDTTFRAALDPKVRGTVALCEALTAETPDFVALFSSAIAHTGNPGQSNYAAGSTFQDAYGRHMASRSHLPVTVFDWGFWGEEGAVATDEHRRRLAGWGVRPLSAAEGLRAFRQALAARVPQIAPIKVSHSLADAAVVDTTVTHRAQRIVTSSVIPAVRAAVAAAGTELGEPFAPGHLESVDAYARRLLRRSLTAAHLLPRTGETTDVLARRAGVVPERRSLFEALLAALAKDGSSGSGEAGEDQALVALRGTLLSRTPELGPTLDLLDDCVAALPDVLSGRRRGLEILFPGGSGRRVAALYHDDPRTRYFNALATAAVRTAVAERLAERPGATLRILEIGAGTGGTSRLVLDALDPSADRLHYAYTDISPTLVTEARERFGGGRAYVEFGVLDIAGDPLSQGYPAHSYDVVLATNVLHATSDMRSTLAHVTRLMRPGAVLVINEATRVLDTVTAVFGLTDGWWAAEDPDLRLPYAPLLDAGGWSALLLDAGLRSVRAFGVPGWPGDEAGQHLLVAERDLWETRVVSPAEPSRPEREEPLTEAGTDERLPHERLDGPEPLLARTVELLRELYAALLKVPVAELDARTPLAAYGTDSLTTMEALERLERDLGPLPQEALLSGESVEDIAQALMSSARSALATHLLEDGASPAPAPGASAPTPVPVRPEASEPIAVVGVAGRYPMAPDLEAYWANLLAGHSAITDVSPDRWTVADGQDEHRWGAFLDGVDLFDPLLFRISPREAERMDPAERLFLETAWEALEDAGWPPSRIPASSRVGVFVGIMHGQYQLLAAERWGRGHRAQANSSYWAVANRVSRSFGFTGPSMAVDTACSSAFTALHLAVAGLRSGECSAAVVGGVNVILHPSHHLALSASKMVSPTGRPRVFSRDADGMVTGEGVGAVILKRLSDAIRDGDRIHACITGTAVNTDGPDSGYGVPDGRAQVAVIEEALRVAATDAGAVQYVEAQATGSPVGDPVEWEALSRAYGPAAGPRDGELYVGSVKPAVGHLEAASGMAQLTKVLLQLRHRTLVPTIGSNGPGAAGGLRLVEAARDWPDGRDGGPRRAALSSFGAGGANAHVIVEEAPAVVPARLVESGPWLLALSARRPERLREHARRIRDFFRGPGRDLPPADVMYTLQVGRTALPARLAIVVHDLAEAAAFLDGYAEERPDARLWTGMSAGSSTEPAITATTAASADAAALETLARTWVEGRAVDWSPLHSGHGRTVVSLPHYPFARDRHWLEPLPPAASISVEPPPRPDEEPAVTDPHPTTASPEREAPSSLIRAGVTTAICDILGLSADDIDLADHLSDFGFDSVTMVQLADRLSAELGMDVDAATLYGYRDVAALVTGLACERPARDVLAEPPPQPAQRGTAPVAEESPVRRPVPAPTSVAEVASAPTPLAAPVAAFATAAGRSASAAEPVAVVGMAGAFPGSPDLDAYWDHLIAGHDLIQRAPHGRLADGADAERYWGGFLDGVDCFDAGFFQISPREARLMDPQHRLFLQTVWAAVEEAGHDPADLAGTACGLYAGVASSDYGYLAQQRGAEADGQLVTGSDHSMLANRISFLLDLRGPSEPVDTACSSSLVAVHRAVRAIQSGECETAIAGGVNVILTSTGFDAFSRSGMLASDGRCKTFDHRADGYVRGEGVGAVLLKPLSRAQADGDHIHALITGTATNHGGRAASLTAPNPEAQAEVISLAQRRAGIGPEHISYVEAHGTGTALGDPIEFNGLLRSFGSTATAPHCGLGSVKTNVGHLETAAGMAGLFKVILSLRHRMLPPTLHIERTNPRIKLTGSPFYLVGSARTWDTQADPATGARLPRRAGVSSFGFGGMNAHLIVEEPSAPEPTTPEVPGRTHIHVLSAHGEDQLRDAAVRLHAHLRRLERDGSLHRTRPLDVAFTLQTGRPALPSRLAVVAGSLAELADAMGNHLSGAPDPRVRTGSAASGPGGTAPDGPELAHLIGRARAGDADRLADVWVGGAAIDWHELYEEFRPIRVSLPTYAFAKDRHWMPDTATVTQQPPQSTQPEPAKLQPAPQTKATTPAVPLPSATVTFVPPAAPAANGAGPRPAAEGRTDALHRHIREAVADGIGIATSEVDTARDFASYGVDSIGAMRIMQHIQNRYGDHIPMAAILEHPSVDKLSAHLDKRYVLPNAVPIPAPAPPQATPVLSAPRMVDFGGSPDGPAAYCLFGDTGELSWLLHLGEHLGTEGPVVGLEAPGFDDRVPPQGGIEELADRCAEAIAARHTSGPCRIVGQGLSGLVAAETVRALLDRGVEVAELLLVGTPEPGPGLGTEPSAASVSEVSSAFAAVWGAPGPVDAECLPPGTLEEQTAAAAEQLAPHAPLDGAALRDRLLTAARWRAALATAAGGYPARPVTGAGAVTVIRPSGAGADDFGRWIAPPPVVHEVPYESWSLGGAGASEAVARLHTGETAVREPVAAPSPLVPINQYGNGRRSFWAHNLYGEVSYAIYLSRHLGLGKPLIGLEQIGVASLDSEPQDYPGVKEMAAHYVRELREQYPGGPYLLGGCSFGGVLAYEMAYQLQRAGEEVSHLIAIDPIMPTTEAWDSVDWGTVTAVEAEAFSVVMLGNAMCQRWGVVEQITLGDLTGLDLPAQLDRVARHIHDRSPARPDPDAIKRSILVRHKVMLRNGDLLQEYRPEPLLKPVPTTLFHATQGFLAEHNDNQLPAVPRTSDDKSNGLAGFVGDRIVIHEMEADHHTIAHNENLARIADMLSPLLERDNFPASLFPASLYPAGSRGGR